MATKKDPTPRLPATPEIAFGQVLREHRIALRMTQLDLETESGIDRSYVSQLENGLKQPCLKTIIQIAYKIDVSPGELLDEVVSRIDKQELQKLR